VAWVAGIVRMRGTVWAVAAVVSVSHPQLAVRVAPEALHTPIALPERGVRVEGFVSRG
jgi:hypothetical protein